MTDKLLRLKTATIVVARSALKTAQVKAAVDGFPRKVVDYQNALEDLERAQVEALPDRTGDQVQCHMTVEELRDLQTAVQTWIGVNAFRCAHNSYYKDAMRRFGAIATRLSTTIMLNQK